ncbi:unnamed protein product [Lota lota]
MFPLSFSFLFPLSFLFLVPACLPSWLLNLACPTTRLPTSVCLPDSPPAYCLLDYPPALPLPVPLGQ